MDDVDTGNRLHGTFELHKMLQMDGVLTLLIMGIGYMIVPRFRNIQLGCVNSECKYCCIT
jgi:hypothetical protein